MMSSTTSKSGNCTSTPIIQGLQVLKSNKDYMKMKNKEQKIILGSQELIWSRKIHIKVKGIFTHFLEANRDAKPLNSERCSSSPWAVLGIVTTEDLPSPSQCHCLKLHLLVHPGKHVLPWMHFIWFELYRRRCILNSGSSIKKINWKVHVPKLALNLKKSRTRCNLADAESCFKFPSIKCFSIFSYLCFTNIISCLKVSIFSQEAKDLINLKILMLYGRILVAHCGCSQTLAMLLSHLTTRSKRLRAQGAALDSDSVNRQDI